MKKKLLLLSLLACTAFAAEPQTSPTEPEVVKQQYGYGSIGLGPFPMPLPIFSGGYRMQNGHHGADVSLQATSLGCWTLVKTNALYLHYFKPSYTSEFYAGGGVTGGRVIGDFGGWFTGPEFIFGKQYLNESQDLRFFQAQVTFPTITWMDHHRIEVTAFPMVVLSYGLGF